MLNSIEEILEELRMRSPEVSFCITSKQENAMMKVDDYILCPVRDVTKKQKKEIDAYIDALKATGRNVHSYRDVDQSDPTGYNIVMGQFEGMKECEVVHVFWDVNSAGSHCDLGMAMAFGKEIKLVKCYNDNDGKSYWKALKEYVKRSKK